MAVSDRGRGVFRHVVQFTRQKCEFKVNTFVFRVTSPYSLFGIRFAGGGGGQGGFVEKFQDKKTLVKTVEGTSYDITFKSTFLVGFVQGVVSHDLSARSGTAQNIFICIREPHQGQLFPVSSIRRLQQA